MARQPFFGRGAGPQIARMNLNAATAPGRAYGQAFANLGGQIGKTIEQYQLNKEKRAKLTGEIEAMLPNYLQDLTMSGDEDADKKNMLRIEKFRKGDSSIADLQGLAGELAMKDRQTTKDLDQRYKEAQIRSAEFKNRFNEADEENRLLRSTLETEGVGLLNRLRESQLAVADIEKQLKKNELGVNEERLKTELEQAKASLARTQEEVTQKRNTNSVFRDLHQIELTKFATDIAEAQSALAINAEKLDQLRASRDVDLKTKEANLEILEAERKELEQDLSERQNLLNSFSASGKFDENDPIYKDLASMNLDDAFQGDLAGIFFKTVGNIGSFVGAELTPETATEGQKIESLNALLRPAMVAQLSSRPSNYTLEQIQRILPQTGDGNQKGKTKIRALLPILSNRLKEAQSTVASGKKSTTYYQDAKEQAVLLPKIIQGLEAALQGEDSNLSTGETSTNVKFKIRGQR